MTASPLPERDPLPGRTVALVFLGSLAFFCAYSWLLPITDPVESTLALAAREMLQSGDLLSPRLHGRYWYDKPALLFWLLILSFKVFGISEFAARLPSACAGAATVAFSAWFYDRVYASTRGALIFASLLAGSVTFWTISRLVLTDSLLVASIGVALACAFLHLRERSETCLRVAWGMLGVGVLAKGPVAIVLPAFVLAIYSVLRRDRTLLPRLFSASGLLIFLSATLPWYWFMYGAHGSDFVNGFLGLHHLTRATVSEHPEDDHLYYYLCVIPFSLLPWTLVAARAAWTERREEGYDFALAWILGFFLFFTAVATKYLTYCLPAVLPALLLAARSIDRRYSGFKRTDVFLLGFPCVLLWTFLAVAGLRYSPVGGRLPALLTAVALSLFLLVVRRGRGPETVRWAIGLTLASLLASLPSGASYMHERSAKGLAAHLPQAPAAVACHGACATSAVFYSGQRIVELGPEETGPWAGKFFIPHELPESFFGRTKSVDSWVLTTSEGSRGDFLAGPFSRGYRLVYSDGTWSLFRRRGTRGGAPVSAPAPET